MAVTQSLPVLSWSKVTFQLEKQLWGCLEQNSHSQCMQITPLRDLKLYELHRTSTRKSCWATLLKSYHPLLDVSPLSIQPIIFLQTEKGKKHNLDEKSKHRTFRHALPGLGQATQLHMNVPGRAVLRGTGALCSTCLGKAAWKGDRGVWGWPGVLSSFFSLSTAKPPVLGDRSKESNESWIPDPVKSRLITREASTGHFPDENCCQIMFPVEVWQTGQTGWIQLISGHPDLLDWSSTELLSEHQAFCLHLTHLTAVAAPRRVQEDRIHQCRRGQHWELPNELEFPPGSKLFKDPQVWWDFSSCPNEPVKSGLRNFVFNGAHNIPV